MDGGVATWKSYCDQNCWWVTEVSLLFLCGYGDDGDSSIDRRAVFPIAKGATLSEKGEEKKVILADSWFKAHFLERRVKIENSLNESL